MIKFASMEIEGPPACESAVARRRSGKKGAMLNRSMRSSSPEGEEKNFNFRRLAHAKEKGAPGAAFTKKGRRRALHQAGELGKEAQVREILL